MQTSDHSFTDHCFIGYTRRMSRLLDDGISQIDSLHTPEELRGLKNICKNEGNYYRASAQNAKRRLQKICDAMQLDFQQVLNDPAYLDAHLPDQAQQVCGLLHELYRESWSPEQYMERIVRRLAPDFRQDSVRLAILKQFVLGEIQVLKNYPLDDIRKETLASMTQEEREEYDSRQGAEQTKFLVDHFRETLFEKKQAELGPEETLQVIRDHADKMKNQELFRIDSVTKEAYPVSFPGVQPSDETKLWMKDRELEQLQATQPEEFRAVVSWIRADYLHQLQGLRYRNQKGELSGAADWYKVDERDALAREKKKKENNRSLLDLCQNLADGMFKTNNGSTRIYLYYFAYFFHMTVRLAGEPVGPNDSERDLVKNLFHDYYNDNLIRYLSPAYRDAACPSGSFEREPDGTGINFKNYVEVIYLYYLWADWNGISPGKRIKEAEATIRTVSSLAKKMQTPETSAPRYDSLTAYYQDLTVQKFYCLREKERSFADSEGKSREKVVRQELKDFIVSHYAVVASKTDHANTQILRLAQGNSATHEIGAMMERIDKLVITEQTGRLLVKNPALVTKILCNLLEKLEHYYPDDPDFLDTVRRLSDHLQTSVTWLTPPRERQIRVMLAHLVKAYPKEIVDDTLENRINQTIYGLRKTSDLKDAKVFKIEMTQSEQWIDRIGIKIVKKANPKDHHSYYRLADPETYDETIAGILAGIRQCLDENPLSDSLLESCAAGRKLHELLEKTINAGQRVTRSTFLFYCIWSVLELETSEEDGETGEKKDDNSFSPASFRELYAMLSAFVSPKLEECRYQRLSPKIFSDMSLLAAVYLYDLAIMETQEEEE